VTNQAKTRLFVGIVILSSLLGNLFLSWGLRAIGQLSVFSPLAYLRALFNPWVAMGVVLLTVWLLSQMALLSWADLSYVLPVTAIGYVLTAFVGRWFLNERISLARWAGIVCITLGVALVERSAPQPEVTS
jgi:drug/metabolite transporter (DMT)-like permease